MKGCLQRIAQVLAVRLAPPVRALATRFKPRLPAACRRWRGLSPQAQIKLVPALYCLIMAAAVASALESGAGPASGVWQIYSWFLVSALSAGSGGFFFYWVREAGWFRRGASAEVNAASAQELQHAA